VPVYQGEEFLKELKKELYRFKLKIESNFNEIYLSEVIFVLDSPNDNSEIVLEQIKEKWMSVITLSKNFGQHPATVAGILHSSGDWIITIDEDLQHNPRYILPMLKSLCNQKADICYAKSSKKIHSSLIKDQLASYSKYILSKVLNNKNIKDFNSFRVIRGNLGRAAASICRKDSYLDISLSWFTDSVITHNVLLEDIRNQSSNSSGYSLIGLMKHAKRMVMSSKVKLLRIGILIGSLSLLLSSILISYTLLSWFVDNETFQNKGWTSIMITIIFYGGLITFLLGVAIESISDILINNNGKPTYFKVDRSHDSNIAKYLEGRFKEW